MSLSLSLSLTVSLKVSLTKFANVNDPLEIPQLVWLCAIRSHDIRLRHIPTCFNIQSYEFVTDEDGDEVMVTSDSCPLPELKSGSLKNPAEDEEELRKEDFTLRTLEARYRRN
jgi:hypothetical protein